MMRYYKDSGDIFALSDIQAPWPELIEMTTDEIYDLLNPPQHVLKHVSRAQGKSALIRRGLWPGVMNYAASIEDETDRQLADVALNDTTDWQRSSPFLNAAVQALGLTDEQIDELFIEASQIQL